MRTGDFVAQLQYAEQSLKSWKLRTGNFVVQLAPTASGQAVVFVVGGEQPLELVRKVPLGSGQRSS